MNNAMSIVSDVVMNLRSAMIELASAEGGSEARAIIRNAEAALTRIMEMGGDVDVIRKMYVATKKTEKIPAVRLMMKITGKGLIEAKKIVDSW
jgi:ribosomal protein L7/L12